MKQCDISKVQVLRDLFGVSPEERGDPWIDQFYAAVVDASFRCEAPQIFIGPDGFPYFSLLSPEPLKSFESFCICNLVEAATNDGFGIAINRRADGVDWVFTYGDLLSLRLTGSLRAVTPTPNKPAEKIVVSAGEHVLTGAPSESYLPSYTRAVIRRFMQDSLGVAKPGVFLMHRAADPQPQQLLFSVFPEQFRSEAEYFDALKWLSWFLPRYYSITGIPKSSDLCRHFVPL
jgi:hypothetical protein